MSRGTIASNSKIVGRYVMLMQGKRIMKKKKKSETNAIEIKCASWENSKTKHPRDNAHEQYRINEKG